MAQPIEIEQAAGSIPTFPAYDSALIDSFDPMELERGDHYEQIAERRAQLECAATLRRVRAL